MKRCERLLFNLCACAAAWYPMQMLAQPFDITTFDVTSAGPWSDVSKTTLVVPKVANNSITLDGTPSSQKYGGFQGITVTPGMNAWILDYPSDRVWDNPDDSSFTFWLAHDDTNLYVGVQAKDDIVNSDDPNASFWKDDAIEIVTDALADRLDNNTDNSKDPLGGHCYINYLGKFSAWDDASASIATASWSTAVDWKYGEQGDIYGVGKTVTGGWAMEVRFNKRLFQDAAAGNQLKDGYRMGFNIGIDDDDKHGLGTNGDQSRTEDLDVQYFWANRQRRIGFNADYLAALTPDQKAAKVWLRDPNTDASGLPLAIDSNGRLSHGGSGEIFFGYDKDPNAAKQNILFLTSNADSPTNADPSLIALLRAKGYTVTPMTPPATAAELRTAATGKNLVFISETVGSASVVDPVNEVTGVFSLKNTDIPIISFEAYMYDNADWVQRTADGANDYIHWGNTSRADLVDAKIQDARDSLYIQKPNHPIAKGLSGKVKVYNLPYSLSFGVPSADADVIASVEADGSYPTLFVYEKGDKLADGSVAPNKRIGLFLGQAADPNANWSTDYADLSEAGKTLLLNTIAYALGTTAIPGQTPTLSVARNGQNLILTYANGTLQSADVVTGPWNDQSGASPLTIQPTTAGKFYRVKSQ